ncbi:aminoimidazole riboside kinase [compost metagenome]
MLVASRADLAEVGDPWQHARQLAGDQLEWLVLTEGKAGAVAIHGEEQVRVAARPVSVVDTTGAGDAFAGGLIHGLARGMAMRDALQCAVDWGAFAVASESSIPSQALKTWLKHPH